MNHGSDHGPPNVTPRSAWQLPVTTHIPGSQQSLTSSPAKFDRNICPRPPASISCFVSFDVSMFTKRTVGIKSDSGLAKHEFRMKQPRWYKTDCKLMPFLVSTTAHADMAKKRPWPHRQLDDQQHRAFNGRMAA